MIELPGKYNTAKVFTDNVDSETMSQIIGLCSEEFSKESQIRIMPDTHAGAGCVIGTTMTIHEKVVPNLVGVDIGCGMETIKLNNKHIEFEKLDKVIRKYVPSGFDNRTKEHKFVKNLKVDSLRCLKNLKNIKMQNVLLSCGSLGGGNHFIEINQDKYGYLYLVIHSGSRNLGVKVATYYQDLAIKALVDVGSKKDEIIKKLKAEGKEQEIQAELKKIQSPVVNKQLAYVFGQNFDDYIHDMTITQEFAMWNRKAIADTIINEMKFKVDDQFSTIHNYINPKDMILRKGAISAHKGEKVLIPINMRDGSIIAIGKGNPDWNFSAPHGAGRLMSRSKAKDSIPMKEFKETMKDVWTTSVCTSTLDEAPQAYKPMEEILENIQGTVDVVDIIKPLYNYKAN
jgi:RNA-splicing ligase RtcB